MSLIYNGTSISNIIYNGTSVDKVYYNGTIVFEKAISYITNSSFVDGVNFNLVSKVAGYGPDTDGSVNFSGTSIQLAINDFYEASRTLDTWISLSGKTFIGNGNTVTINNTFVNGQLSQGNDHQYNRAILYAYNVSTGNKIELGSIKTDGVKTFTLPNDGATYTFYLNICAWAGLPYSTQTITVNISELKIN